MSDFLINLAARVAGSAESIRPRLPSLFEPRRHSHQFGDSVPEVHEETSKVIRQESAPLQADLPRLHNRGEVRSTVSREDGRSEPVKPLMQQLPPAASKIQPAAVPRATQPVTRPSEPPPPRQTVLSFRNEPKAAIAPAHRVEIQQPAPLVPPSQPPRQAEPIQGSRVDTPQPSLDRIARLVRSMLPAGAEPPVRARAGRQQPAHSVAPEPVINVTIGRIEVRATSQPTSGQTKDRIASPVMSLDDYLQQRRTRA